MAVIDGWRSVVFERSSRLTCMKATNYPTYYPSGLAHPDRRKRTTGNGGIFFRACSLPFPRCWKGFIYIE
jgi:hypothetical protein